MSHYVNPHKFSCPWYPYAQEFGAPNIKWCEETLCQWVSEPANTWSNFSYIIVGLLIAVYTSRRKVSSDLDMFPRLLVILGLASGFYHASNNYLSQLGDFLLMFMFVFWGLTLNLKTAGKINDGNKWYFYLGMNALFMAFAHYMYISFISMQWLIVIAVLLFLVSEWQAREFKNISYKFLTIGLLFVIAGEAFSIMDLKRILCDPQNHYLQGHAIWHVLAAIGLGIAFFHFAQTETNSAVSLSDTENEDLLSDEDDTGEHHVNTNLSPDTDVETPGQKIDLTSSDFIKAVETANEAEQEVYPQDKVENQAEDEAEEDQLDLFSEDNSDSKKD